MIKPAPDPIDEAVGAALRQLRRARRVAQGKIAKRLLTDTEGFLVAALVHAGETGLSQSEKPSRMNEDSIMSQMPDAENKPLSDADLRRMKRTPQVKVIRRALRLSQEEFARRYGISVGTLRDWEQNRSKPDTAAVAYLKVIAREPELVRKVLAEDVA